MYSEYCLLGGSGSIGSAILSLLPRESCYILNSSNCDLSSNQIIIPEIRCSTLIISVGTFSGLKQYESASDSIASRNFLKNFYSIIISLKPCRIIHISSASLDNPFNFCSTSSYFNYVILKASMEAIVNSFNIDLLVNIRPTNIISKYENVLHSGHSVTSLYRLLHNTDPIKQVWSSHLDWREYLDSCDLARLVIGCLSLSGAYTFSVGSGRKTYIHELVNLLIANLNISVEYEFTQPYKAGPLPNLIGTSSSIPISWHPLVSLETSVASCVQSWKTHYS